MQNRGAIKAIAIILAIACAYQLSFTFVARNIEKKAARYAEGFPVELQQERQQSYLDSIKSQKVFLGFTYKQVKEREINLGLDLKGGMNVMLEISVEDVVRALSNDSQDPIFNAALSQARSEQKNSAEDFITLFSRAYADLSGNAPLALIFNTQELREKITPTSTNEQVIRVLREEAESAIDNSFNVLRSRIDRFGVTQPNIQKIGASGRILVELPGVKEPERVRKLLQGTASLEFWLTYNNTEIFPMLEQANAVVKELQKASDAAAAGEEQQALQDTEVVDVTEITDGQVTEVAVSEESAEQDLLAELENRPDAAAMTGADEAVMDEFPLFAKLSPALSETGQIMNGPVIGYAKSYDTAAVNSMLNTPQVRMLLPRDVKLMWGVKPIDPAETTYELYAIKANTRDGKAPLDGSAVADAKGDFAEQGSAAEVSMTMTPTGAKTWARMTADNIGEFIAIVLDGYVYSAPRVNSEIPNGRSSISGQFTIQEAKDLANVLKSGKLPAPARITQEAVVGPSLGQESINSSMISFVIAFCCVLIYMMLFYNKAGMVASIALVANLFFLFGVLASFGAVLTLPGIAGIVLTMGMAVDANVLIYERVKEELRGGKGLSLAVNEGYKNAMSAIIDSNVTTIITGIVLFVFGNGPVQGFATTLIIGILTSLFTSLFITRLIFTGMLSRGKNIRFSNKWSENFLQNVHVNFLGIRKWAYGVSLLLIVIAAVSLMTRGLNYGVEFSGGRTFVIRFDQVISDNDVRYALDQTFMSDDVEGDAAYKSFEVKQFGSEAQMQKRITTQYKYDDDSQDANTTVERLMYEALAPLFATPLTFEEFHSTATNPYGIISADMVGPSVASDITRNSFIAVFIGLFAIGIYIIIRFRRWQWGAGSVIALAHDAFLTIGVFSLFYGILPFSMEVNQSFIAAILTIIGYSINDKVVVFDRIREYMGLYPKRSMFDNINNAINHTLSRTINTSATTFVVLLAIFLFGGEVIRGFVFALMFGVVIGTLSSIFLATPVSYDLMSRKAKAPAAPVKTVK
ncbi:MAG: protein translocase subunit SecDF [Alistipes inops]|jgi:SecD/SecF fusion protein|nr:protein translocase subunit SecDF [Rikenellaceae bacterium]MEE0055753.1 protein translocase subunit SecDF [Alistipes inops]